MNEEIEQSNLNDHYLVLLTTTPSVLSAPPTEISVSILSTDTNSFSNSSAAHQSSRREIPEQMVTSSSFSVDMGSSAAQNNLTSSNRPPYLPQKLFRRPRPGTPLHFLGLSSLVFITYICYGLLQEALFTQKQLKPFGWFLTWMQFGFYVLFGSCEFLAHGRVVRNIPIKIYFLLALLTVATMGLSNTSLRYLNYPTQVIFKSCKLIPVMIGGIFMQKKRYAMLDYIAMWLLCVGLVWFTLADSTVQPNFHVTGVFTICMALVADAVIGNAQELYMKRYSAANTEVVFFSYLLGVVYILLILVFQGSMSEAVSQIDMEVFKLTFIFSLAGYLGVKLVLDLVWSYGALIAVTVTTCRKALTILISFIAFSKPFTVQYVLAGGVIFIGIFLNVYSKNRDQMLPMCLSIARKQRLWMQKVLRTSSRFGSESGQQYKMVQSV